MSSNSKAREQWGSQVGFILAAAGSAIGLGNIWRFPYLVGMNGGAAFVIIYIAIAVTVGLTVMLTEFCLGRASQKGSVGAFKRLAPNKFWRVFGWLGLLAGGFIILSYYGVIAGWTVKYMFGSFTGLMGQAAGGGSGDYLNAFLADSKSVIAYQVGVMAVTVIIVACGVGKGIEQSCKYMMPGLFIVLLILIARSVTLPGAEAGLEFYLKPDFSKLSGKTLIDALGQGFFSLSLGMGIMITYGSYLSKSENLPKCALLVFILDTLAATLAGLAIFPALFAMGMEPAQGVGLTFVTLPGVFAQMPAGAFFSFLFFLLLFLASLTSMMSLLEVSVTFLMDEFKMGRVKAALSSGSVITILGIPSAYSLSGNLKVFGMSFFDFMDYISNNIMMPINAIGICLFAGWIWTEKLREEITNNGLIRFAVQPVWITSVKIFAPAAIAVILASGAN
ncbi:MAG: sodium-dependent transporter [Synergistaceae bacterium]|jgi:NSS family neurotransmitter:Na+ symporter|nr:sodium-dependent transporter [Synergistaceae bacterium]